MSIESRTQDAERGDATRTEPAPPVRARTPGAILVAAIGFSRLSGRRSPSAR